MNKQLIKEVLYPINQQIMEVKQMYLEAKQMAQEASQKVSDMKTSAKLTTGDQQAIDDAVNKYYVTSTCSLSLIFL